VSGARAPANASVSAGSTDAPPAGSADAIPTDSTDALSARPTDSAPVGSTVSGSGARGSPFSSFHPPRRSLTIHTRACRAVQPIDPVHPIAPVGALQVTRKPYVTWKDNDGVFSPLPAAGARARGSEIIGRGTERR